MMYSELVKALRDDNACLSIKTAHEAADAIEELQAVCKKQEIDLVEMTGELASKPKWIPVTERLPKVRTWVLCYCRANSFDVFRMTDEGNWQYGNRSIYMKGYVTHWMPLPEPPKEETE